MRLSKPLRDQILRTFYDAGVRYQERLVKSVSTDLADKIYDELFGRYAQVFAQYPPGFCSTSDTFVVDRVRMPDSKYLSYLDAKFKMSTARPFPADKFVCHSTKVSISNWGSGPRLNMENFAFASEATTAFLNHLIHLYKSRTNIQTIATHIQEAMDIYVSVEAILAAIPAIKVLLPADLAARVKNPRRRRVYPTASEQEKIDGIQALLTAMKIAGAFDGK